MSLVGGWLANLKTPHMRFQGAPIPPTPVLRLSQPHWVLQTLKARWMGLRVEREALCFGECGKSAEGRFALAALRQTVTEALTCTARSFWFLLSHFVKGESRFLLLSLSLPTAMETLLS